MENNRNSASYPSHAADPPLQQPLPDSYAQKRSSYRRPTEAQPVSLQIPVPLAPDTVPSNSARPVAALPAANGIPRASSHRRRQSQQIPPSTSSVTNEALPAAPDVPRGPPPTAYRDPYAPKGSRSSVPTRTYSGRSRDPTLHINTSRQQPNVQIAPSRLQELRATPNVNPDAVAGVADGIDRRNSQGRRPSVPDRSPLQKLEGKLDDISKEERRARILEAELAAQEKAEAERAARRARENAAQQQRNVSGPVSGSERAGGVPGRTVSTRRHVSLPAQTFSKTPNLNASDDAGVMYDLSEPWNPAGPATQLLAGAKVRDPRRDSGLSASASQHQKGNTTHGAPFVGRTGSVKGKEADGVTRGPSFRERAGDMRNVDGSRQNGQRIERKPVVGPTGLGLLGVDTPQASSPTGAAISRYDTKRPQKDLPPTPTDAIPPGGRSRDSRGILAAQMEMEQERLDRKNGVRGFDHLQMPPSAPASKNHHVDFAPQTDLHEPQDHVNGDLPDVFHHEQDRRYVPPAMLEEWKGAPIASLHAEDLDLDTPERTDSTKKAWWEESSSTRRRRSAGHAHAQYDGNVEEPAGHTTFSPPLYLKCGPLLRYTGIRKEKGRNGRPRAIWRGSVMIVTVDDQSSYQAPPVLRLFKQPMDLLPPPPTEIEAEGQHLNPEYVDPIEGQTKVSRSGRTLYVKPIEDILEGVDLSRIEDDSGLFQETRIPSDLNGSNTQKSSRIRRKDGEKLGKTREIAGVRLHAERGVTFWRFNLEVELSTTQTRIAYRINRGPAIGFWVPPKGEMMNIMFHSCNGFSLSVDSKEFCGPDPLWRDVLNNHQTRPFHVMIGGGDQIYNDAAMRDTTLFRQWTESRNPMHKHHAGFSTELQNELEQFYLDRYSMWFSQGLFGMANSQIPMVNIWDDHDIIDGYGSYPHHFMQTPVFTGLGAVAFKYYMLFQHQSVVAENEKTEPSWLLGDSPGPYIKEHSRNLFMSLGHSTALLGLDCRTERQRDEIMTEKSWDKVFDRLEDELIKGETKHLIVLLGVPIAYPRLNFLENILTSRLMDPIKTLGRAGLLGNFVNKFDGGVEILDDLDDHWTAKHHKDERNWFIRELQHIAKTKSVRVTILGGDVHLAAIGQFYSNKNMGVPKDKDFRYMPNIISSAIVNTPPPDMMADILNRRNKVHHFDPFTDEDMIPLFTHDVDGKKRNNTHLLPRRNWCSLREYKPGTTPPGTPTPPGSATEGPRLTRTLSDGPVGNMVRRMSSTGKRGRHESGPPVAYYNNPAYAAADGDRVHTQQSSFSPSPEREERPRSRRSSFTSLFRRRASVDSVHPPGSSHSMPTPNRDSVSVSQERPSPFHRRPSVLGKKGAMRRDGAFINLEGGLDICLNLEVSQKDPAGITAPYRLLVPALDSSAAESGVLEKERRRSRFSGIFGLGNKSRKKATIGDEGRSLSGSEIDEDGESHLGEIDEEERTRQRYKVGPRILIPGLSRRKDREREREAEYTTSPPPAMPTAQSHTTQHRPVSSQIPAHHRLSVDHSSDRRASAPLSSTAATTLPTRASSTRQPTHNSSHKSQLPTAPLAHHPTAPLPPPSDPDVKVHRRSMGGILNQHGNKQFEHDAHVLTHTPSTSTKQQKRDSYPPHPAIVGAGPGSPYSRGGVEARDDSGYMGSGGRNGYAHNGSHGPSKWERVLGSRDGPKPAERPRDAGVGARYLGHGRYEDEDEEEEEEEYSDEGTGSVNSFVPPKTRSKWKIWK